MKNEAESCCTTKKGFHLTFPFQGSVKSKEKLESSTKEIVAPRNMTAPTRAPLTLEVPKWSPIV